MTPGRILITGAAGFVGRHLLAQCRAAWPHAHLTAACREEDEPAGAVDGADETAPFDLLAPHLIAPMVAGLRPDVCFHLAARADVAESFDTPDLAWAANVDGTRALAAAFRAHAPQAWLLNAGTAEAYGLSFLAGLPLTEEAPLRPANPYAASKAAIDIALGEMAVRGLRVIRMRPLNHIGPGQSARFAVASFARQIARIEAGLQEPVIRTGALDRARDFLDVRDVCAAYVLAVSRAESLPSGAVFNLASGQARPIGQVLSDLLDLSTTRVRIETAAHALRPFDLPCTRCSAAAALLGLGWVPAIPWATTLGDLLGRAREESRRGCAIPPGPPVDS